MTGPLELASNFNRLGAPVSLQDHVQGAIPAALSTYAGGYRGRLNMAKIADFFGVAAANVTITDGVTEGLALVFELIKPKVVYVLEPTFWEYAYYAEKHGSAVVKIADDGNAASGLARALRQTTGGLIVLCSPNNPTGRVMDRDVIQRLARDYPNHTFLVDETYLWFCGEYRDLSTATYSTTTTNIITVTSLSKIFSVPGLRIGLVFATEHVVDGAIALKVPHSVLPIQQLAAEFALANCADYLAESAAISHRDRREFTGYLDRRKDIYSYDSSMTHYVFVCASKPGLYDFLKQRGVAVRDGAEFGGGYANAVRLRMCAAGSPDSQRVIQAFQEFAAVDTAGAIE